MERVARQDAAWVRLIQDLLPTFVFLLFFTFVFILALAGLVQGAAGFQRAGAAAVAVGVLLTVFFQSELRRKRAASVEVPLVFAEVVFIVGGTVLWGFGDLIRPQILAML